MYSYHLGKFGQTDPTGYADSMNLYGYCFNNPVVLADPYGLMTSGQRWGQFFKGVGQAAGGLASFAGGTYISFATGGAGAFLGGATVAGIGYYNYQAGWERIWGAIDDREVSSSTEVDAITMAADVGLGVATGDPYTLALGAVEGASLGIENRGRVWDTFSKDQRIPEYDWSVLFPSLYPQSPHARLQELSRTPPQELRTSQLGLHGMPQQKLRRTPPQALYGKQYTMK